MKRALIRLAALLLAFALLAFVAICIGLVPVAASSGHWKATGWLLHFAMRQSVGLRAHTVSPSERDLADSYLIVKGAGHYAGYCLPCHGWPGQAQNLVVASMTPPPPSLQETLHHWQPKELFWIVKHGIKLTAMPAWPTQARDDEVWAVVAFMLRMPELSPAQIEELVHGDTGREENAVAPLGLLETQNEYRDQLADCRRCHGREGRGRPGIPALAGQSETYLLQSLRAYSASERHSGIMQSVAARLTEPEMHRLAKFFAQLPAVDNSADLPKAEQARQRGALIAHEGIPEQGVPPCASCHGPADSPRNPIFPRLSGLSADYIEDQLRLWRQGTRGGTPYSHLMSTIGARLKPSQAADVARFYEALEAFPQ